MIKKIIAKNLEPITAALFIAVYLPVNAIVANQTGRPINFGGQQAVTAMLVWIICYIIFNKSNLSISIWLKSGILALMILMCVNTLNPYLNGPALDGRATTWIESEVAMISQIASEFIGLVMLVYLFKNYSWIRNKLYFALLIFAVLSTAWCVTEIKNFVYGNKKIEEFSLFSAKKNVLVVLIDSFQGDILEEIMMKDSIIKESLKGFTYFKNTSSSYGTTKYSVTELLSGEKYKSNEKFENFLERQEEYLTDIAAEAGYESTLIETDVDEIQRILANDVVNKNEIINNLKRFGLSENFSVAIDLALYKAIPLAFKQHYYNDGKFQILDWVMSSYPIPNPHYQDINLIEEILNNITVKDTHPQFKYLHLHGCHYPINYDQFFNKVSVKPYSHTRDQYVNQCWGAFRLVMQVLSVLNKKNIKNNTSIIIISDHGTHDQSVTDGINEDESIVPKRILNSSRMLFLAKPENSNNELVVNNSPQDMASVRCFITNEIDARRPHCKKTIGRKFYDYTWSNEYWTGEYGPPMLEYTVPKESNNYSGWRNTGLSYENGAVKVSEYYTYTNNAIVKFGSNGNANNFIVNGFDSFEDNTSWSVGKTSTLRFILKDNNKKNKLTIVGAASRGNEVKVIANNTVVGEISNKWNEYVFNLPDLEFGSDLVIRLKSKDPKKTCDMEYGKCRYLGLLIESLRIE